MGISVCSCGLCGGLRSDVSSGKLLSEQAGHPFRGSRGFVSTALIGISVFFASNMGFVPFSTELDKKAWFQVYKTRTLVDLSGEILLFAHHLSRSMLHIRREYDSIQSVLQNQYMQYCQSRETIDLINRKYHDLKHQITLLRAEPDHARRKEYLDEMEREDQELRGAE